jgi:cystathionine beta-lyase/cystathionine gamma-synthase
MKKDVAGAQGLQTKCVHASQELNRTSAINPPIWQTSTFRAESSAHFAALAKVVKPSEYYSRYGNPTHEQVEAVMAALEGGEAAMVTASGMGAISTSVLSLLERGDHVVAQRNLYANTTALLENLLPRWGIECTFVDQTSAERWAEALRLNTKLIYAETPTNPLMRLTDLQAVAALGKTRGITTIVDNTFATPINQRPLQYGVDVVVHSATKYLGGHSDITAGVIIGSPEFIERAWRFHIVMGAALSPFDAWLLLRGLRTLGLRVERHNQNGLMLARFFESHPKIERVNYPGLESHPQHELAREQMNGFTGMMSVELRGGYETAERFISSLKLGSYAASLGGFETLLVHPAAMWGDTLTDAQRRAMEVGDNLVRISVGLEDEGDLIDDFSQALEQV